MADKDQSPWEVLERRKVLERGEYLRVEDHIVRLTDGRVIEDWPWVETPDVICVLARTEDGKYLAFQENKYALQERSWSIVGGMVEVGETPLESARRELLEETGFSAPDWQHLGEYVLDANRGVGKVDLFSAVNARKVAEPDHGDLEEQELILLSKQQLLDLVLDGAFQILPWTAAVALFLLREEFD